MGDLLVPEDFTVAMVDGVRVVFTRAALGEDVVQFEWNGVRDAATDRRDLHCQTDRIDSNRSANLPAERTAKEALIIIFDEPRPV